MHKNTGEKAKNPVESLQWRRRPEIADFCPLLWSNVPWVNKVCVLHLGFLVGWEGSRHCLFGVCNAVSRSRGWWALACKSLLHIISDDLLPAEEALEVEHLPAANGDHQHDVEEAQPDNSESGWVVGLSHSFLTRSHVEDIVVVISQIVLMTRGPPHKPMSRGQRMGKLEEWGWGSDLQIGAIHISNRLDENTCFKWGVGNIGSATC